MAGSPTRRGTNHGRLSHPLIAPMTDGAVRIKQSAAVVAAMIVDEKPPPHLAMALGATGFSVGWCIVLFFHLFNAFYTLGMAYIYFYLRRSDMEYYVAVIGMMEQSNFIWITVIYALISATNFYSALRMILFSMIYRQLVFGRIKVAKVVNADSTTTKPKRRYCICLPQRVTSFFSKLGKAIGVRGRHFDTMLMLREIVEVSSQTYQAHSSSLLISKIWVNQLFGLLVFLNCGANTAVHIFKEDETGLRRFLCTAIDLFLDFAWGFIFPGNIIFHYLPIFIQNNYSLPPEFYYSDTLFVKAILDCRQFFMVSKMDAVTTTLPYLNMFNGLRNMKVLLQLKAEVGMSSSNLLIRSTAPAPSRPNGPLTGEVQRTELEPGPSTETLQNPHATLRQPRRSKSKWMFAIIPLFGTAVLLTSIAASGLISGEKCGHGCKLQMRPWFGSHCACSVLEVNCFARGISGTDADLRAIFVELDARVLNSLIVTHCPALAMPTEIQRFPQLLGIEFYNVSLVEWSKDAALSEPYFPLLGYLYFARSRLETIPEGLTHDLTSALIDIEISGSIIGSIPNDLDQAWPWVMVFYIEFCGLHSFPEAVLGMGLTDFSIIGNDITSLPENATGDLWWMYLYIDRNPITFLPQAFPAVPKILFMTAQYTNLSELPPWILEQPEHNPDFYLRPFGSPICTALAEDPELQETLRDLVVCSRPYVYGLNGIFPLRRKDEMRRLSLETPLPEYPLWLDG